jgi:hypothetical protein
MAVMLEAVRAALSLSVFAERDLFKLAHPRHCERSAAIHRAFRRVAAWIATPPSGGSQ